jgi:hypothetical protein
MVGAEELLGAVDRQLLHLVHHLAAAVVALARQPLGVLVRERDPMASITAGETKFSLAISSSPSTAAASPRRSAPRSPDRCEQRAPRHPAVPVFQPGVTAPTTGVHRRSFRVSRVLRSIFRRAFVPPASNGVSSQVLRIRTPSSSLTKRAGSTSTFASLCLRASSAISGVQATAARTPGAGWPRTTCRARCRRAAPRASPRRVRPSRPADGRSRGSRWRPANACRCPPRRSPSRSALSSGAA